MLVIHFSKLLTRDFKQVDYFLSENNGSIVDTGAQLSVPRFDLAGTGLSVIAAGNSYKYSLSVVIIESFLQQPNLIFWLLWFFAIFYLAVTKQCMYFCISSDYVCFCVNVAHGVSLHIALSVLSFSHIHIIQIRCICCWNDR